MDWGGGGWRVCYHVVGGVIVYCDLAEDSRAPLENKMQLHDRSLVAK